MSVPLATILDFLRELSGVDETHAMNAHFFFYDPRRTLPHDKRQPFATLVTTDEHDVRPVAQLSARNLHRLNLGVGPDTYRQLFGPEPSWGPDGGPVATGHDFATVDKFLPHPIYAPLSWISIIAPTTTTWPLAQTYAHEAHQRALRAYERLHA